MATSDNGIDGIDGIQIGIDLGTSTKKISGTYRKNGKFLGPPDIQSLQETRMVPAVVAYHDGKFHWGQNLLTLVAKGKIPAEKIMQHYKILLHEPTTEWDAEIRNVLVQQLAEAGVTIVQLYVDIFTHLTAAVRSRMCHNQIGHILSEQEILGAPVAARITLPQSFGPAAARTLTAAAAKSGFSLVNITSEQICALAAYLDNLNGEPPFSEGDAFVLVDAGCFTVDSVLYIHRGGQGTTTLFEALAQSHGSIFGSLKVDLLVQKMVEDEIGPMQQHYDRLDLTPMCFNLQLRDGIETAKRKFNPDHPDNRCIHAIPITNDISNEELMCRITQKMIRDAFDIVFDENFKGVDDLLQKHLSLAQEATDKSKASGHPQPVKQGVKKPLHIVLSGGGGQCSYMLMKYKRRYETQGITIISVTDQMNGDPIHVAQGALSSRYGSIKHQELPLRHNYAFLQDEIFSFDLHPDCWTRESTARRYRLATSKKVGRQIPGAPSKDRIVPDRLCFLGRKGQIPKDIQPVVLIFNPRVDEPVVELTTVVTELDHLQDHDAALTEDYDVAKDDNKLRDGVLEWAKGKWVFDKKVMSRGGWEVVQDTNTGNKHYQAVHARLSIITTDEKNLVVKLELMLPDENGKTGKDGKTSAVDGIFELYNPRMGEFLSDADAGSRLGQAVDKGGDSQMG